jgi:pilus assembly protein Flp/PilA
MNSFVSLIRDEDGASAAEYALILAIVGLGIVLAAIALQGAIGNALNKAANCINSAGPTGQNC